MDQRDNNPDANKAAVVLLSGGLDSATTLAIAQSEGYKCVALSFVYGQRHDTELESARTVAASMGVTDHRVVELDPSPFRGSALTDAIEVPKGRDSGSMSDIPVTYVPARNLVFLSIATATAESIGASDLYIGANQVDYSGYPDCRGEFLEAFSAAANLATKAGVEGNAIRIHAPLLDLTKQGIIELGVSLGVDYGRTHSCYDPIVFGDGQVGACGQCDSCILRREGFKLAGVPDPTRYAPGHEG